MVDKPQTFQEEGSFEEMQSALEVDRLIHEPARLLLMAVLRKIEWAEFNFLLNATHLSKGNLSKQSSKLEEAGYIQIEKYFKGKVPATRYRITDQGRRALDAYWAHMTELQNTMRDKP